MTQIKSEGKCLYCEKMFSKTTINRHLQKHLTDKVKENKPGKSFLLKVEADPRWKGSPYFLSLWANGEASMQNIDNFLRKIWLECCGHLSSFTDVKKTRSRGMWNFFEIEELLMKGKMKEYDKMMEEANGEIPMSRKLKTALSVDMKIKYSYDFGSTTNLQLSVVSEYPVKADSPITLLSRNEPPELYCQICGKEPATAICSACFEENSFCKKCGRLHAKTCSDFDDYSTLPIVNSPRMGVCGYEGGTIDKERDGPFVKR